MRQNKFNVVELIESSRIWTGSEVIYVPTQKRKLWSEMLSIIELSNYNNTDYLARIEQRCLLNLYLARAEKAILARREEQKIKTTGLNWKADLMISSQWFTGLEIITVPSPVDGRSWYDLIVIAEVESEVLPPEMLINHLFDLYLDQIY